MLGPDHHEDHQLFRPFCLTLYTNSRRFLNGWVTLDDALELDRAHLDPSQVHGVVGPPLGPDIAATRVLEGGDLRNRGEAVEPQLDLALGY